MKSCRPQAAYDFHVESEGCFKSRILVVDRDAGSLRTCRELLAGRGYNVLTATDGFAALCVLKGAIPELLITELNLPHMSGFELLSVVRKRFPSTAVIAISGEYSAASLPREVICDAFLAKGPNLDFELVEEVRELISQSPLRGSLAKADKAPVWIPRSRTGYVVLTCPECLRSFSVLQPKNGPAHESCVCCGADVQFEMSSIEVPSALRPQSQEEKAKSLREKANVARAEGEAIRVESRRLREKKGGFA